MTQPTLIKIQGTIDNLTVWKGEEDFVMGSGTQAVGAATAVSAAAAGLAGAAASAAINSGDSADSVEFFSCTLNDKPIFGRFGTVSFKNKNEVIMAAEEHEDYWEAYAVCRPKDRRIWMYPHCSRGNKAYWVVNSKRAIFGSLTIFCISMIIMGLFFLFDKNPNWGNYLNMWVYFSPISLGILMSVFSFCILYFSKFGRLSSTIFKALGFKKPNSVDLEKHLKNYLKTHSVSKKEREQYHFYKGWVYRY